MTVKLNKTSCPVCDKKVNAVTDPNSIDSTKMPEPDDLTVCVGCRSFLRFDKNLQLIELTPEEIVDLTAENRSELIKLREALRKIQNEH